MYSIPKNATSQNPAWARFGLRSLLLIVLFVAAFFGGWASQQKKLKALKSDLDEAKGEFAELMKHHEEHGHNVNSQE